MGISGLLGALAHGTGAQAVDVADKVLDARERQKDRDWRTDERLSGQAHDVAMQDDSQEHATTINNSNQAHDVALNDSNQAHQSRENEKDRLFKEKLANLDRELKSKLAESKGQSSADKATVKRLDEFNAEIAKNNKALSELYSGGGEKAEIDQQAMPYFENIRHLVSANQDLVPYSVFSDVIIQNLNYGASSYGWNATESDPEPEPEKTAQLNDEDYLPKAATNRVPVGERNVVPSYTTAPDSNSRPLSILDALKAQHGNAGTVTPYNY